MLLNDKPLDQQSSLELATSRAVLPQNTQHAFTATVADIIAMGQEPRKRAIAKGLITGSPQNTAQSSTKQTSHETTEQITEEIIEQMQMAHLLPRLYHTLSGGEQQRVHIARVLAQQTDILLLDEPIAALDIAHQHQVMQLLANQAKAGKAMLVVLHEINIALRYATQITLLHQGRVHAQGKPENAITPEKLNTVYGINAEFTKDPTTQKLHVHPVIAPPVMP